MTMMMTSSLFGPEDMEALLWASSSPMADVMDSLIIHPDKERQSRGGTSLEQSPAPWSPLPSSSSSSSSSPPPFYSPPPSPLPPLLHEDKAGTEEPDPSIPWLNQPSQQGCTHMLMGKEDVFSDLEWMTESVDLDGLDLDRLIEDCSPNEESSTSPEDFLSLDCPMELDSFALPSFINPVIPAPVTTPPPAQTTSCPAPSVTLDEPQLLMEGQEVPSSPSFVPEPQEELEIKSEPSSPDSSIEMAPPTDTLDLGSEVDVSALPEAEEKPVVTSVTPQLPKIVLSLSPTRIVLVLAPKNKVELATVPKVVHCSSSQISSRTSPYPVPREGPSSSKSTNVNVSSPCGATGAERTSLKAPKDRKVKKMEQNKTAATRYRQKKRAEQDSLASEHAMLERKNVELTEKAESMAREIEYLKELMEEVRVAKLKKGPDL